MTRRLLPAVALFALTPLAVGQQPMPPDKQAEVALTAGQKAYNDGNLQLAQQQFQQVVQKFGNTPSANAARFGLALCYLNTPQQDIAKAIEYLTGPAGDGNFADRGQALVQLGVAHRALALKEANPDAANKRFEQA